MSQIHTRNHESEKPFKCDICQKGLSSKIALKDHLNKHTGKKPYKCDQCTRAYATRSGLTVHLKMHSRPQPYICHYCDAAFAFSSEYDSHIRYEEETDDDVKCHICKKAYVNSYYLIQHNKRTHPDT